MTEDQFSRDEVRVRRPTQLERSRATRERVIKAAIELLHTEGYSGATTLAVRRAAAVSMGALQHQFPTKAELMAAVQERLIEARFERIEQVLHHTDDPLGRIERFLDVAGDLIGTPLFAASMEIELARRSDKELDRAIAEVHRRSGDGFMEVTQKVIEGFGPAAGERVRQLEVLTGALIRGLTVRVVTGGDLAEVTAAFQVWRTLAIQLITDSMPRPTPARVSRKA